MTTNRKSKNTLIFEKLSGKALSLGHLLLAIRQGEELSQVEFSAILGISRQCLCDLEHHRRFVSPKMAAAYAKKLRCSPDQFVRLCLQDMLKRDGLKMEVELRAA